MLGRGSALLAAGGLVAVLVVVGLTVPVPYVTLGPGPVCNTVGAPTPDCQSRFADALIRIAPASAVHRRAGDTLALTTVSETDSASLFQALGSYLSPANAVIPRQVIYPPGQSTSQVNQADTQEMAQSQNSATVAALSHLGFVQVEVAAVRAHAPASGRLRTGDVLLRLDGRRLANSAELVADLGSVRPGSVVTLQVERGGRPVRVRVLTGKNPQSPSTAYLGIYVRDRFTHGLSVQVGLRGIGGPSAGLMLTLGILDELSPTSLTGGRVVAGTGTIDDLGDVGPIGGIQQKMYAARHDAHASDFLAPVGDCAEAAGAIPAGLTVLSVHNLDQALSDLAAIRAGRTAGLPRC